MSVKEEMQETKTARTPGLALLPVVQLMSVLEEEVRQMMNHLVELAVQ